MEETGSSQPHGLLSPAHDEDSVDIYADLDVAEKSSPHSELRESMNLYEEIVTEEQQSRESSYTELKTRFQAAQNQIKELHRRLEQMKLQNTGLNTENHRLKKNISALLQTARQEVTRKDAEIQRLNQQSQKIRHAHHSRINSSTSCTSACRRSLPPSLSSSILLLPPSCSVQPPPPLLSSPPPPPPPPTSTQCPPLLSSSTPSPPPPNSTQCPPLLSSSAPPPGTTISPRNPSQLSRTECNDAPIQPGDSGIEIKVSKLSSHHPSKSKVPDRQSEHSVEKSDSTSSAHHKQSKHREGQKESTDRRHRSDSREHCRVSEINRSHRDTGSRCQSRSFKTRDVLNAECHHRSQRPKSPPAEVPHTTVRSSADTKGRNRDQSDKSQTSILDAVHGTHDSKESSKNGYNREPDKIRSREKHHRDRKQHTGRHHESSKEREGGGSSRVHHRKGERRREEKFKKHKKSSSSETSRDCEKRSKQMDQRQSQEGSVEILKASFEKTSPADKDSTNRKLCFMETLNLTLSPAKKPVQPVNQQDESRLQDEDVQPDFEDMCVVDETDIGNLEAGPQVVDESHSANVSNTPSSEDNPVKCDTLKVIQVEDKNQSDTTATDQTSTENSVQSTSEKSTSELTAVCQRTAESPTATDACLLEKHEDEMNFTSDPQTVECGKPEDTSPQQTENTRSLLQKDDCEEPVAVDSNTDTVQQLRLPVESFTQLAGGLCPKEPAGSEDDGDTKPESQQLCPTVLPQDGQKGPCLPASSTSADVSTQSGPKDADPVSSTISLESFPHEGISLPSAIRLLTNTDEDTNEGSSPAAEPSSSTGCIGVSKVSSTTEEFVAFSAPKKTFSPGKTHMVNEKKQVEPSSSVPVLHDEDSMMRMLCSLKKIPDAISPLRSPVRLGKRGHLHGHSKLAHVKSLQKDFCVSAVEASSKKLDVNKENKCPCSPTKHGSADQVSNVPASLSDTDLEEGEIVSESDEPTTASPVPPTKRPKMERPVKNHPSPKTVSKLSKKKSEERRAHDSAGTSSRSPSGKSRFKTVCPAATKASFSTIDEVMETFKLVRTEFRKKYMKLHKTFPKKSFYGMMENFQQSFLEFVDGAHFGQICSQAVELKTKLKKMITTVFNTVSNNGIIRRIFDQQAVDLKQKLWDFVDAQVDYLLKDIRATLRTVCKQVKVQTEDKKLGAKEKESKRASAPKSQCGKKVAPSTPTRLNGIKSFSVASFKTGLGSRGKGIRMSQVEKDKSTEPNPPNCVNSKSVVDFIPPKTPEKLSQVSVAASQSGSSLDKTDFEILTEQQASSLTFNLVRDSQMGEIFKCLLQGADLLENSGDNPGWTLSTPKDALSTERLHSITTPNKCDSPLKILSPLKFESPSKLVAAWSSISPRKMQSSQFKEQEVLNPALFDENCLLELPSESRVMVQSSLVSQRTYSILAEDLAVSLTIPSPLKSDSHLSFLQPSTVNTLSTPNSVISAHISEDALLDEEDATEQDIHLALDTDISSSSSTTSSAASEPAVTPFLFKPDLPMQLLVMEKSNDHFIVKIRQTDTSLTADNSLNQTLTEDCQQHIEEKLTNKEPVLSDKSQKHESLSKSLPSETSLQNICQSSQVCQAATGEDPCHLKTKDLPTQQGVSEETKKLPLLLNRTRPSRRTPVEHSLDRSVDSSTCFPSMVKGVDSAAETDNSDPINQKQENEHHRHEDMTSLKGRSKGTVSPFKATSDTIPHNGPESCERTQRSGGLVSQTAESFKEELSESDRSLTIAEDVSSTPEKDRKKHGKRKKHQSQSKAKRVKNEEKVASNSRKANKVLESQSPNSLSAKNVIRKKGEVVMAWTRDDDRLILTTVKTNGVSNQTFTDLAEKLKKPEGQVAHRFHQLMKLFKKREKMDS
ncbi:CASP8-associated protein 2 [Thalassophryne amazonica]|uniref:CASP8-associated protein 2 n=1 Tax=Thalassophryne amazonica TaxID=390379 RepID=UPI0014712525|nr:CASP8-associated protein 2 [Thalassophryne amazonica]